MHCLNVHLYSVMLSKWPKMFPVQLLAFFFNVICVLLQKRHVKPKAFRRFRRRSRMQRHVSGSRASVVVLMPLGITGAVLVSTFPQISNNNIKTIFGNVYRGSAAPIRITPTTADIPRNSGCRQSAAHPRFVPAMGRSLARGDALRGSAAPSSGGKQGGVRSSARGRRGTAQM